MEKHFSKVPEEIFYDISQEHLSWQTIGVFNEMTGGVGTGTALKAEGHSIIITAAHVLVGVKSESLTFGLRNDIPLSSTASPPRGFRIVKKEVESIKLPVRDIHLTDPRREDLAFILLDNKKPEQMKQLIFLGESDIEEKTPEDSDFVTICGFPDELSRRTKQGKITNISVGLYFDHPKILADPGNLASDFDPSLHFLLQFPLEELQDKKTLLTNLKGMSGASVRRMIPNTPGQLWKFGTKIIGIQIAVYSSSRIYKCTRSEILLKELRRIIGPS
jgi:hypothetical protein